MNHTPRGWPGPAPTGGWTPAQRPRKVAVLMADRLGGPRLFEEFFRSSRGSATLEVRSGDGFRNP